MKTEVNLYMYFFLIYLYSLGYFALPYVDQVDEHFFIQMTDSCSNN